MIVNEKVLVKSLPTYGTRVLFSFVSIFVWFCCASFLLWLDIVPKLDGAWNALVGLGITIVASMIVALFPLGFHVQWTRRYEEESDD
jgi:hypothetical protein